MSTVFEDYHEIQMFLLEASRHEALFSDDFIDLMGILFRFHNDTTAKQQIRNTIKVASKVLQKSDRMVWYVRWYKLYLLHLMGIKMSGYSQKEETIQKWEALYPKELKKLSKSMKLHLLVINNKVSINGQKYDQFNDSSGIQLERLKHFYSLNIHEIDSYRFRGDETPFDVIIDFTAAEEKWRKDQGRLISQKQHEEDPEMEVFLEASPNFVWFHLDRSVCRLEGEKMGHCGNAGSPQSGDTILSLRERIIKAGEVFWKPHATFILDSENYIGEMKGFANEKPGNNLHPYIVKLLEDERISGIKGGGYLSQNNFSIYDLDEDERERLLEINPDLTSFEDLISNNGFRSEVVQNYLRKEWGDALTNTGDLELDEHENMHDLMNHYYSFNAFQQNVIDIAWGDIPEEHIDLEDFDLERVYTDDLEQVLGGDNLKRIEDFLRAKHPDLIDMYGGSLVDAFKAAQPDLHQQLVDLFKDEIKSEVYDWCREQVHSLMDDVINPQDHEYYRIQGVGVWTDTGGDPGDVYTWKNLKVGIDSWSIESEFDNEMHSDPESYWSYVQDHYDDEVYNLIANATLEHIDRPKEKGEFDYSYFISSDQFVTEFQYKARNILLDLKEGKEYSNENYLIETHLFENNRIEAMFSDELLRIFDKYNQVGDSTQIIKKNLKSFRATYKKSDRVIWLAKQLKLFWFHRTVINGHRRNAEWIDPDYKTDMIFLSKELEKFDKKNRQRHKLNIKQGVSPTPETIPSITRELDHFFSLPIEAIQDYEFKFQDWSEVHNDLTYFEQSWKEELGEGFIEEDGTPFVKVTNDLVWFDLEKSSCQKEGSAMGHCGNTATPKPGDTILSLRSAHPTIDYMWKPHLTFILNENTGLLGEMKGRGNDKPAEKYHDAIVELLLDRRIKGIGGGGYDAKSNFSVNDLDKGTRDKLIKQKPTLLDSYEYLKAFGVDDHIKSQLKDAEWDISDEGFIVDEFKDFNELIEDRGNDVAKWILKVFNGDNDFDTDYVNTNAETINYNLSRELEANFLELLRDRNIGEFDMEEEEPTFEELLEADDEIMDELSRALRDATQAGAEKEMREAMENAFKVLDLKVEGGGHDWTTDGQWIWDVPVKVWIPWDVIGDNMIEAFEQGYADSIDELDQDDIVNVDSGTAREYIIVEEPRYGFNGFDDEYYNEEAGRIYDDFFNKSE